MTSQCAHAQGTRTFSLTHLALQPGERIVGFRVDIRAGAFESVAPMPVGWSIDIDNDASWQTSVEGGIEVGSAALGLPQLAKLRFLIKKNEFGGMKFSVAGTVTVTKDFEHEREIKLSPSNIHFE